MLLYTVRYGVHGVYSENYAVLAVRCKFQDSVFLRLTVRCDTVRYGNLLQYYNTVYTTGYTGRRTFRFLRDWPFKPKRPPRNQLEGWDYLSRLQASPKDFEKFLRITGFYSGICT